MKKNETIAEHILEYLREHPASEDTLEGVVRWWMRSGAGAEVERAEVVHQAIEKLRVRGQVQERVGVDGRRLISGS